jgi:hypothetical protein
MRHDDRGRRARWPCSPERASTPTHTLSIGPQRSQCVDPADASAARGLERAERLTGDEVAEIVAATEPPDATSLRHGIAAVPNTAASAGVRDR